MNDGSSSLARPTPTSAKLYELTSDEFADRLKVDPARGLTADEVQRRLQTYGANALAAAKAQPAFIRYVTHSGTRVRRKR